MIPVTTFQVLEHQVMKNFGIIECIMGLVLVWFVSCHYFEDASLGRIRETCLFVSSLAYNILIGPQEEVEVNVVRNNLLVFFIFSV